MMMQMKKTIYYIEYITLAAIAFLAASSYDATAQGKGLEVMGDTLYLPHFNNLSSRFSLGSTVVIKGEELEKYSSTDIRNVLTAITPGVNVNENYGGPGVTPLEHTGQYGASTKVSVTTRGKQMMYMVDNIPVNIDETVLDPQQIESITIVRDALETNLYGPTAANGIVFIKTKHGMNGTHNLFVNFEGGVHQIDRFPEYVSGTDYAKMNNIARNNDGLSMLYSKSDVLAYANEDPYDLSHPNVNYRDMMLKDLSYYTKANFSAAGGTDNVRYFAFLGYAGEDDYYDMGPVADYNRVNINANLDVKLQKYVTARLGLMSTMGIHRSPNYRYNSTHALEMPTVLEDINGTPAIAFPIYANNDPSLESPWYAVSSLFTQNPIANILENGSYTETIRKGLMNVELDVNLSPIVKGLKSITYGAYDVTNMVRRGKTEDYAAYILVNGIDENGNDILVPQQSSSHSVKEMANKTKLLDYFSNRFYLVEKLDYDRTFGKHAINAGASYMITKRSQKFISEHRREIDFGYNGSYVYNGKYIFQTTGNYHGTYSLINNRWSFSPSVGFGWIISDEEFMQGFSWLDYLKIRAQGGLIYYDSYFSAHRDEDNYTWNNSGSSFGPYPNNQWFGSGSSSVNRTYPSMLGNPNLRLEKRRNFVIGFDGNFFNRRLDLSADYFYSFEDGPVSQLSNVIPLLSGVTDAALWMNYQQNLYQGYEVSAGWHDKIGDWTYSLKGWASGLYSKVIRADELNYKESYRSKEGFPVSSLWGFRCKGVFETDEETTKIPQLFDDELHAGDLKYEDMNGDGYIDDNDICYIGNYSPKLSYGISVNVKYKRWDLTLTGSGRAFYDIALTNEYFWNGWGDGNYSKYTRDNVTNANHPRLTYNKVNNNFRTSTYWLKDGSYFKIQTLELGYEFPSERWTNNVVKRMRILMRINNLCTLTGIDYVDPESINAGVSNYPLERTFVIGLKFRF